MEIPHLNQLRERYQQNPDVVFLAISSRDDAEQLQKFLNKTDFAFEIVPSSARAKSRNWPSETYYNLLKENFGTTSYPTNIIIDKSSRISYYKKGFSEADGVSGLRHALEEALGE